MGVGDNAITDVAIKVFETKPAVVNFNYQEISDQLDLVLAKYKGLVFDENAVSDCKKTIAELRKGQKSLDEFRKSTKKKLTESVTAFENQCKTLYGKFDEVIAPLSQQYIQFELERKEQKRAEIQSIIDALSEEHGLDEKFASQLVIPEDYFNKGKTLKAIKSELAALANTLKTQQDKEQQDLELIKTKVELANAQYQLPNKLMPNPYLSLLRFLSVEEIADKIKSDALQASYKEKEREAVYAKPAGIEMPNENIPYVTGFDISTIPDQTAPISTHALVTETYEVAGTEEQLRALEAYLDASGLSWKVNDDFMN